MVGAHSPTKIAVSRLPEKYSASEMRTMPRIAQRPGHPVGCADPSCSWGALILTSRFLALPLAVLPLLLPHLLTFLPLLLPHLLTVLPLLLPDLPAFQALLRLLPPLVLRFVRILLRLLLLGSLISLRWVRSTIHDVLPLVGFAHSRCSCSQRGPGATLFPPVRRACLRGP